MKSDAISLHVQSPFFCRIELKYLENGELNSTKERRLAQNVLYTVV